jgi:hypothetical protein
MDTNPSSQTEPRRSGAARPCGGAMAGMAILQPSNPNRTSQDLRDVQRGVKLSMGHLLGVEMQMRRSTTRCELQALVRSGEALPPS